MIHEILFLYYYDIINDASSFQGFWSWNFHGILLQLPLLGPIKYKHSVF